MTITDRAAPTLPDITQDTTGAPFAYSDYEMTPDELAGACAWIEGEYVPPHQARISVFDSGFLHSDVTYTVFHMWHGNAFRLDDHLDRLFSNAASMRIEPPFSKEETARIALECVSRSQLREAYVSISITRGYSAKPGERDLLSLIPQMYVYAIPYVFAFPPAKIISGVHAMVAQTVRRASRNTIDPQIKNFAWNDLIRSAWETRDRGFEAPILLDGDGLVAEGPGYNVFAVRGDVVHTPARNALPGITRKTVVEIARYLGYTAVEDDLTLADLVGADEAFTATTAGGVTPLISLDGVPYGDGTPGPITRAILERYWQLMDEPSSLITPVTY